MTVTATYTSATLVRNRCKIISADLIDTEIDEFIVEAESLIDCVMRFSLIATFNATKHAILQQCATELAAYAATSYDPSAYASLTAYGAELETLWYSTERLLAYLEDSRTVDYLKSL